MKELKDTVDLMLSDNWEDRLRAEIYQCQIRREKLAVNLHNADRYDPLYEMYQSQLVHMLDYECDLTNRAAVLGVELESDFNAETDYDCSKKTSDPLEDPTFWALLLFLLKNGGDRK